jgi:predicted transcriptional regulator
MNVKLTPEQRDALRRDAGPVPVEDEQTNEVFFIVDRKTLDALRRDADANAIRQGIADMEAGRVMSLDELDQRIRAKLELPRSA